MAKEKLISINLNNEVKKENYIALFTNTLVEGGAERQLIQLANILSDYYTIYIVIFYGERISKEYLALVNKNVHIAILRLEGSLLNKIYCYHKFLKTKQPTIVFNYLLMPNLIGGLIARSAGIKNTIGGIRSAFIQPKKVFLNKIAHNYINHYTIFNNQRGLAKYTGMGFKRNKAVYIPNMVSENIPLPDKYSHSKQTPIILSVGRFIDAKDYESAIKIISNVHRKGYQFEYIICGWGNLEKEIRNLVESSGIEKITKIYIRPSNLHCFYQKADLYLQTSIFEGLSNTVMEAMSYGLPCVVTNVGDNNLLIDNEINGYLCAPKNITQFSEKIIYLLKNPSIGLKMGENNKKKIAAQFGKQAFKSKYLEFIKNL